MHFRDFNGHTRALFVQASMCGIGHEKRYMNKDPFSKAKPAPGFERKQAAPVDLQDGELPEADWNKDIRAYYDAVVEEPVPQEFLDLLAQIASDISE